MSIKPLEIKPIIEIRTLISEFTRRLGTAEETFVNLKDGSKKITLMQHKGAKYLRGQKAREQSEKLQHGSFQIPQKR